MNRRQSNRVPAVLETSFWVAACEAEVAANCLDLFEIVVPHAVEVEIGTGQVGFPDREYPYATLFRHLRGQMRNPPEPAPEPIGLFGAGEAEAIALAQHLDANLLINDRRPAAYAAARNLAVVTVPAVILRLRSANIISERAARRKLALIEHITSPVFMEQARKVLDSL